MKMKKPHKSVAVVEVRTLQVLAEILSGGQRRLEEEAMLCFSKHNIALLTDSILFICIV